MNDDLPTTYNPINNIDISTPIGLQEHQRQLDELSGGLDDSEQSYVPFLCGVALLAVLGLIFTYT